MIHEQNDLAALENTIRSNSWASSELKWHAHSQAVQW
jgi:hypothetical protein